MEEVYEPHEDSFLILKHIGVYAKGKSVLEIGTGSGILAEEALKYAKDVIASDISKRAVAAARRRLHGKVKIIHGDLFSNIKGCFDLIIFNPPYLPEGQYGTNATDGGPQGREVIARFLNEAMKYLNQNGIILMVFSSLTGKSSINAMIKRRGYKFKLVDSENLFFEKLYLYEIRA